MLFSPTQWKNGHFFSCVPHVGNRRERLTLESFQFFKQKLTFAFVRSSFRNEYATRSTTSKIRPDRRTYRFDFCHKPPAVADENICQNSPETNVVGTVHFFAFLFNVSSTSIYLTATDDASVSRFPPLTFVQLPIALETNLTTSVLREVRSGETGPTTGGKVRFFRKLCWFFLYESFFLYNVFGKRAAQKRKRTFHIRTCLYKRWRRNGS